MAVEEGTGVATQFNWSGAPAVLHKISAVKKGDFFLSLAFPTV